MNSEALTALGRDDFFEQNFAALAVSDVQPGRIVGVERTLFRVQGTFGLARATLSGRLRYEGGVPPTVGTG